MATVTERMLGGISRRLSLASEGHLEETDLPQLLEKIDESVQGLLRSEAEGDPSVSRRFRRQRMYEGFAMALRCSDKTPEQLRNKVVQQIAMLLPNLKMPLSIEYLFRYLNPIFEDPPDLSNEDQRAYFVTILKHIALEPDRFDLLLVKEEGRPMRLPLFSCCVRLMDCDEPMVQIASRTAILQILNAEHQEVKRAIEEPLREDLAPAVSRIARHLEQKPPMHATSRCRWMRGDAAFGKLSESDPLKVRWSHWMPASQVVGDLNKNQLKYTKVILQFSPGERPFEVEIRFQRVADAVATLTDWLHQDEDDFRGFIQDLCQDRRDISAALQEKGLSAAFASS